MNVDKKFVVPSYCHPELVSGSIGRTESKVKDSEINSE